MAVAFAHAIVVFFISVPFRSLGQKIRAERQYEGISKAKERGVSFGRKKSLSKKSDFQSLEINEKMVSSSKH